MSSNVDLAKKCGANLFGEHLHGGPALVKFTPDQLDSFVAALSTQPAENIHSCSYECDRPTCVKSQRDELRDAAIKRTIGEIPQVGSQATPTPAPVGWQLVPVEPTHGMISAMSVSKARDDEGALPALMDMIDYSGENKTRTVLKAAYKAMLDAAPSHLAACAGGGVMVQWFHVEDERPLIPPDNDDDIEVWTWDGKTVREDEYGDIYEQPAGPAVGGWVCVGHGFAGDCYTRQATHWALRKKPEPPLRINALAPRPDEATSQINQPDTATGVKGGM